MSIFTTALAFHEEIYRDIAKISILTSLLLSMLLSFIYFKMIHPKAVKPVHKRPPLTHSQPSLAMG